MTTNERVQPRHQGGGLKKRYGKTTALGGLDLTVEEGTVLGVLGPNGAGKTTTVRILATLLRPDAGRAELAGFDVDKQPDQVRARIGLTGQYAALDELLTGREMVGLLVRNLEAVQNVTMTLIFPLTFLSSAFVPTETMPQVLQIFVAHQPMTQVVDAVRALVLGHAVGAEASVAWSLAIVGVFAPIAVSAYGRATTR